MQNFHKLRKMSTVMGFMRGLFDYDRGKQEPHPRRDWMILLGVWLAAFVLVGGASVRSYLVYSPASLVTAGVIGREASPLVNMQELDRVLSRYRERAVEFAALLEETIETVVDPSLLD